MIQTIEVVPSTEYLEWTVKHEHELADKYANRAVNNARKAQHHYYQMYDACRLLFEQGAHHEKKQTWAAYFQNLTGLHSSRYYQLNKVVKYARLIEAETGILPTETELRDFPTKTIPIEQKQAILALYDVSKQVVATSEQRKIPNNSDFALAQEVIIDIQSSITSQKKTDTDELIGNLITTHAAERDKRQLQYIRDRSKWETVATAQIYGVGLRKRRIAGIRYRTRIDLPQTGKILVISKQLKVI